MTKRKGQDDKRKGEDDKKLKMAVQKAKNFEG
jgi:hypothetical protein